MFPPKMRSIRYDSGAAQAVDESEEKWPRSGDQVELFEFIVTRDPREGLAMTESGITRALTIPGLKSVSVPQATFVYEIDDDYITVRTAKFEDAKQAKAH